MLGPAENRPVIVLDRVGKTFSPRDKGEGVIAVDDVSVSLSAGEIVGIIGRSGAGKSTLVRLINGLETPTSGTVTVDGVAISSLDERGARQARRAIGMVFQHFNLLSSRTAADNIALPLEIAGRPKDEIKKRVDELLGLVGLTAERDRYPSELSGGQKQRVGIARALAANPKVLLCDEATSALDPDTTHQILELLARIRRELKLTIILITHEMAVVKAIADRVVVLERGRVIEQGTTFEIFSAPKHPTTRSFLSTLGGAQLPETIAARLTQERPPNGQAVVRVIFTGPQANQPVLSRITRVLNVDITIVSGQVETIGGKGFGTLIVTVPGDEVTLNGVTAAIQRLDLNAEVLGYVA
ncbi:methionine import ATP-binding protein MetN [Variibacter gotjawalensis]|uniref:Cell division ATP-binding protein FtsE n=1 Tax=Variibacter gotjawalensis TaxID=1333996 RepID=A0A0S3PUW7_9BRAD|nr:D-methionine transport system ATP-binding protein [Variibacter gotjawalensis]BAT59682.1 methionine import ATP-binding protein MetN [Variibacter gotjawalensis]